MKICAIDASQPLGKNDYYFNFKDYNTYWDGKWRNWHSIPAVFGNEFFGYNGQEFGGCYKYDGFVVSVNSDPHLLIPFIKKLKLMKKKVLISYHESFQDFTVHCEDLQWMLNIRRLVQEADGFFSI